MSLRKLTLSLIVLISVGLTGVILASVTNILNRHFISQEKKDIYLTIQRVKNALDFQIDFMEKTGNDWSNWDDTYEYAAGRNSQYEPDNLSLVTFENLKIDLIILVDNNLEVLYSGVINNEGQVDLRVPGEIAAHLVPGDPLMGGVAAPQNVSGLIVLDNRPMMIVSHPILKTDRTGPSQGTFLLGKFIDQGIKNSISDIMLVSLEIMSVAEAKKHQEYAAPLAFSPNNQEAYYVDLVEDEVAGYAFLTDIFAQPAMLLRISRFPLIYNNGILVDFYLMVTIVSITIMFSIALFFLIEFNVLRRIWQLNKAVQSIGISKSMHERLPVRGRDELGMLAEKINEMLDTLEQAQASRIESDIRFKTLVESMEDVVFSVDSQDRQINIFEKKLAPDATSPSYAPPHSNGLILRDLKAQLGERQDLLDLAFRGDSVQFDWTTSDQDKVRYYVATLSPIYDIRASRQNIIAIVGVSKDMTVQKIMEQDLRNRIDELAALFHISRQLLDHIEPWRFDALICQLAVEQLGMDAVWLMRPSTNGSALTLSAQAGAVTGSVVDIPLNPGGDLPVHPVVVAFNEKSIRLLHPISAAPWMGSETGESDTGVVIPLDQYDETVAVLVCTRMAHHTLREDSLPMLNAFANLVRAAMQNISLFTQVTNGRERLQAVSMRLVEVQEEERRKISLELHDEIGQVLTGVRLSMDMVQSLPPEKMKAQVQQAIGIINEMIARVRQMSLDLRPSILDDLGVIPTLLWFFDRYTAQTGIKVNLQQNNLLPQRFSPAIEITVFRVVQEALTNVARHAEVKSANVRLWRSQDTLGIQIEDEGQGFNQEEAFSTYNSKGLLGMRERVGFLYGQLNLISQPGEGTCLTVEIPLNGFLERRRSGR